MGINRGGGTNPKATTRKSRKLALVVAQTTSDRRMGFMSASGTSDSSGELIHLHSKLTSSPSVWSLLAEPTAKSRPSANKILLSSLRVQL
ncbi:hypothetical protein M5K25_025908 [Dendrobium thyrsiflorum]|uniref:Uncharacterized protein n=1 Tax=Dendrobium thyrsiflorum TaxID=117978 RepID=A0ABD0TW49_DENTH